MKQYEITYLTKEDEKNKLVAKEIEASGGKVISELSLGQKQLSYKIKKEQEAYFTSIIFVLEGEKLAELDRKLSLNDEILRHLIVITKKIKITPQKAPKIKEAAKEVLPEKIEAISEEAKETKAPKEEKEEKIVPAAKPKKKEKPEIELGEEERLKALDEKLNELLKE